MKTYTSFKKQKTSTQKQKTNRATTEVSPWNDQYYNITGGGGFKPVLQDLNAVVQVT